MRFRVTTALLTLLNVALALFVVLLWNRGQARVSEPAMLIAPTLPLPDLAALNSVPMPSVNVATIRDQAVFYSNRAFYQPPPVPTEVPAPEYEMAGSLRLANGKRIAFVTSKADRSTRTLHVGDDLEGWHVQGIDPDRIVLDRNEQSTELRGKTATSASGLVRGPGAPRLVQTGVHLLGATGQGARPVAGQYSSLGPRAFHPPPR